MADEKKVMDVAKPGDAKPNTGSKPMVIGHKSMLNDPAVSTKDVEDSKPEPEKNKVPKKKVKLEPISNLKSEEKITNNKDVSIADLQKSESTPKTEPEKPTVDEPAKEIVTEPTEESKEPEDSKPKNDDSKEESKEEKQETIDEAQIEREEKLRQLIRSKEYYVQINQDHSSAFKTFAVTFIIVLLVGLVLVAALIDAEVLDLGLDLPFDLL